MANAAIMRIKKTELLKLLNFEGGNIISVREPRDIWLPDFIELLIEHPDLDEVKPGESLWVIEPVYTSTNDGKLVRLAPPKRGT